VSESPEFVKALHEACEHQYREYLYGGGVVSSKDKIGDTMAEIQRQRAKIEAEVAGARAHADRVREEMRVMSDPHMREITESLRARHRTEGGLVCPSCGETDSHGNKMNGKPYCFKCNLPLMSAEKAAEWVKPQPSKKASRTFNEPDGVMKWRK